jgi:tetratricopeptide (TPR) repeat protein
MASKAIDIKCPNCGAAVDTAQKTCKYCKQPVTISTFNSVYDMPVPQLNKYANAYKQALSESPDNQELNSSLAMCYWRLKLYDKALEAFEKAMEDNFDNSETFFFAAVCLLKGQKAFLAQRSVIDKAEAYLNAAIAIEPRGIYYYFQAYIKYDYFSRKSFNTSPTYQEALAMANQAGVSPHDIDQLFIEMLRVSLPDALIMQE